MKAVYALVCLAVVFGLAQCNKRRDRSDDDSRSVRVDVERKRDGVANTVAVNAKNQNKNKVGLDRAVIDIRHEKGDRCRAPSVSFQPKRIEEGKVCADKQGNPLYRIKDEVRNWNACIANILGGSLGNIFGVFPLPYIGVRILKTAGAQLVGSGITLNQATKARSFTNPASTNIPKVGSGKLSLHKFGQLATGKAVTGPQLTVSIGGGLDIFGLLSEAGIGIDEEQIIYDILCSRPRQYYFQDPLGCYWQRTCPAGYFESNPNGFCGCTNCHFSHIPYEALLAFAPWSCTNWQFPGLVLTGDGCEPTPFFVSQDLTTNCYNLNICPDGSFFNPFCCACEYIL